MTELHIGSESGWQRCPMARFGQSMEPIGWLWLNLAVSKSKLHLVGETSSPEEGSL